MEIKYNDIPDIEINIADINKSISDVEVKYNIPETIINIPEIELSEFDFDIKLEIPEIKLDLDFLNKI